jgi:hypothetical protein
MKIRLKLLAILVPVILFGGIALAMAVGVWSTETDKQPAVYTGGDYAGEYNPADIRGSYTFEDISGLFKIDLQVLYEAFGVPEGTSGMKSKDLEGIYGEESGVGNESMQVFVGLYKNLPITLEDAFLPRTAAEVLLRDNPALTEEQKAYIASHTVGVQESESPAPSENTGETSQPSPTASPLKDGSGDGENEDALVNGSTTFGGLLDAGIAKEDIENIIGNPLPPTNQTVKDYCIAQGLTFSEIKDRLNALAE